MRKGAVVDRPLRRSAHALDQNEKDSTHCGDHTGSPS